MQEIAYWLLTTTVIGGPVFLIATGFPRLAVYRLPVVAVYSIAMLWAAIWLARWIGVNAYDQVNEYARAHPTDIFILYWRLMWLAGNCGYAVLVSLILLWLVLLAMKTKKRQDW